MQKEAADLWYLILNSASEDTIKQYVVNKNLQNEFDNFLSDLIEAGLITSDDCEADKIKRFPLNKYSGKQNFFEKSDIEIEKDAFFLKWSDLNIMENKLSKMHIDLTFNCNEKCVHCYCDKDKKKFQIHFEDIKQVIDDAYELGVIQIILSGGECTLADDFLKIAQYIRKKRIELVFFTNAQKLYDSTDLFNEVIKLWPKLIGISLYSMNPLVHDRITGVSGSWKKTISIIEKLVSENIPVEIKCFLTKFNFDSYKDVIEYAKQKNCQLVIDSSLYLNKDNSNIKIELDENQIKEQYMFLYSNKLASKGITIDEKYLNSILCQSGHTTLCITPELLVTSCPSSSLVFADLHTTTLKELWINNSKSLREWKSLKYKHFNDCFKYDYCSYCDFCFIKYQNPHSRKMLCKRAKIKMEVAKQYAS